MKKRIWCLLLAGAVLVSNLTVLGADVAYARSAEEESDDNCAEMVDMEEAFYSGFLEMGDAADEVHKNEEAEGQELISPSDGEKKQYIVTLADDVRRPDVEVAETVAGEPVGEISSREAEQILEEAIPEGTIEENTNALEEKNMLLLELETEKVQELRQTEAVEAIEEDVDMTAAAMPEKYAPLLLQTQETEDYDPIFLQTEDMEEYDPLFLQTQDVQEWNREMVGLEENEDGAEGTQDAGMRIAVLDSGVNLVADVPVAESVNLVDDEQFMEGFFMDGTGHGTAVAGIIGARDDEQGITGIDPSAQILSIRILDCENRCPLSRLIAGIQKAEELEADIICMSLGTPCRSVALEKAVLGAQEKGILLIAAAGNGGVVEYPAAYGSVVSVGAVNHEGELTTVSSGREETDLLAPGEDVAATSTFFGADYLSGTSMAAPHVAGLASLLWKKDRNMPAGFIRELLELSAAPIQDREAGVIDYAYALSIYEEFRQQYRPGEQAKGSSLKNMQEVEAVDLDEDVVEARWGPKHHVDLTQNTIDKEEEEKKKKEEKEGKETPKLFSLNRERALLTGAVLPDRWFKSDKGYYFHGGKHNFIAFYRFLCHAARAVYNRAEKPKEVEAIMDKETGTLYKYYPTRSDGRAFPASESQSVTGTTSVQLDKLAEALEIVYRHWDVYARFIERDNLGEEYPPSVELKKTELALSYVIIGMAVHSATDAYAHRAWVKKDGRWVSIKTDPKHDDLGEGGARAQAAQLVCNRTIRRFHEGKKDCVAPFVIEGLAGYGGNGEGAFRMLDFQKCANEITDNYRNKLGKYSYQK